MFGHKKAINNLLSYTKKSRCFTKEKIFKVLVVKYNALSNFIILRGSGKNLFDE